MDIGDSTASASASASASAGKSQPRRHAHESTYSLSAVKTIHTWACITQKSQLEESVQELLLKQVVPLLLGKRPLRNPPVGSSKISGSNTAGIGGLGSSSGDGGLGGGVGGQFSVDIPSSLAATLQDLQRRALGIATIIDGLHARKAAELSEAMSHRRGHGYEYGSGQEAIHELEHALQGLERHRLELKCTSQIVAVVMVAMEAPGLSLYPLLRGYKACSDYRKEQHQNAVEMLNVSIATADCIPNGDASIPNQKVDIPPILSDKYEDMYTHLISHLEPELRAVADLNSVRVDPNPGHRIASIFTLPLANMRAANAKASASGTDRATGADAADIGHSVVHHMLLDMHLLCTCPGYATGFSVQTKSSHGTSGHGHNNNSSNSNNMDEAARAHIANIMKAAELEAGRTAVDYSPLLVRAVWYVCCTLCLACRVCAYICA